MHAEKKKAPASLLAKKEAHPIGKPPEKRPASLPTKDGAPDQAIYDKFAVGSLRRRVWDAITASKCPRCNGDHLRNACPKPRQVWEDDFERSNFFTKPYTKSDKPKVKRTTRVQLSAPLDLNAPSVLWVTCSVGRCLLDTGSDVSLALRELLAQRCLSSPSMEISHLGGVTILQDMGTLHLDGLPLRPASLGIAGVFAVDSTALPEGVVALLGVPDIARLALSLDYVLAHPGCDWRAARPSSFFDVPAYVSLA
jgi:hypothetical protein